MAAAAPRRERTWALALLTSLLLHVAVGLLLVFLSRPHPGADSAEGLCVDACELQEEQGTAYLAGEPDVQPMQAVLVAAPQAPTPAETVVQVDLPPGLPEMARPSPLASGDVPSLAPRPSPLAPPSGATFFDITAPGQTFVYVIDRSASMGPSGGLRAATEQLLASLRQLPPTARFQVIVYNRIAEPLLATSATWLPVTPEIMQQVSRQLDSLLAEGGTDHLPALRRALALHPDVLFFLTDADDLSADMPRVVSRLNAGRHTAIHAIELTPSHRNRADMPMHRLALENRGTYRAVDLHSSERGASAR